MKICTQCGIEKDECEFCKRAIKKDGLRSQCKECDKKYRENNKEKILDRSKNYYLNNKEENKEYHREYYKKNKEKVIETNKKYRKEHKEEMDNYVKKYNKQYGKEHRHEINERKNQRRKTDINYTILDRLRCRIYGALKGHNKSNKTMELLGCSIEELKSYLASQFYINKDGEQMSFDNYGSWHLDHILPCSSFNFTDPEQQRVCFHYTNLQPLWAEDNLKKSNKFDWSR